MNVETLFQPDVQTPSQYFDTRRGGRDEPYRRLLRAILQRAIDDLQYRGTDRPKCRVVYAKAVEWIGTVNDETIFGFDSICESLGIEPTSLRKKLIG